MPQALSKEELQRLLEEKTSAIELMRKELKIESSLEQVRTVAMGMKKSDDLLSVCEILFAELQILGFNELRNVVINIHNDDAELLLNYDFTDITDATMTTIFYNSHPITENLVRQVRRANDAFVEFVISGKELIEWREYRKGMGKKDDPRLDNVAALSYYFYSIGIGSIGISTYSSITEEKRNVLKRFRNVFDFAYRRYMDVAQAEANAREAVKQAALDRIRADIASMRTIGDLDKITPLIWNELTILGISFTRCGVFIMDETQQLKHTFLSTPDGKAIAAFHLPYSAQGNTQKVIDHWHNGKSYIDHWNKSDFAEFAETLVKQSALSSKDDYLRTIPHGGFHLYFLPFLQGMLYVGNTTQLGDEEIKLIQSVADTFSTAYARYEDFNRLEIAKQQIEKALTELKATQAQLIQSEKMASLGQPTAGVAHEIQNPLNFVNNFSDVNQELLGELKDEADKGNLDAVKAIANSVIENEQKISHHGKRADGIVRGMLQHSRTSSGQKEPADINKLAEEHLRLAYQGFRAKDNCNHHN